MSGLPRAGPVRSRVLLLHQDLLLEVHSGHPQEVRELSVLPQLQHLLAPVQNSEEGHFGDQGSVRALPGQGGERGAGGASGQVSQGADCLQALQEDDGAGSDTQAHCH